MGDELVVDREMRFLLRDGESSEHRSPQIRVASSKDKSTVHLGEINPYYVEFLEVYLLI